MAKVLVIEDEAQTRSLFMQCLAFEGFGAIEAADGAIGSRWRKHGNCCVKPIRP